MKLINSTSFSRRNILAFTIAMVLILGAASCWVIVKEKIDHDRQARAIKTEQARLDSLSPEEKSILRTQNYLSGSISLFQPAERLFLDYLQRKFTLSDKTGVNGPPFDLSEDPRTYPQEIHYIARIGYPERIVTAAPKHELDEAVEVTNIYSSNCDHLKPPPNYWDIVEQNIKAGGYYLTHVALAMEFMEENNCDLPPNITDINQRVVEGMVKIADDPSQPSDLRYEAIAFLLLRGQRDLVQSRWIDQIISDQQTDGNWINDYNDRSGDTHTTLLAFWSLLEYSRPSAPDEPIIRRPSNP